MKSPNAQARRKVLIVDDNADAALVLSMCLSVYGYETAVAYTGREAVKLAESFEPEVVFLDLGMPGMDGYEVVMALRQRPKFAHTYVAALTGWNDAQTRARVVAAGFNKHLTKPASVEVVLEVLETAAA